MLEMEVADIAVDPEGHPFAVLRARGDAEQQFAIRISRHAALMTQLALRGETFPRPLTYNLLLSVLDGLGGRCVRAVADAGEHQSTSAFLEVDSSGGVLELACRLEDAVGIAACAHVPVVISDDLLRRLRDERQRGDPGEPSGDGDGDGDGDGGPGGPP